MPCFDAHDGQYTYTYNPSYIPTYCDECGVKVVWHKTKRPKHAAMFDTVTGRRYIYERCKCPKDKDKRSWLMKKLGYGYRSPHVSYNIETFYYRRYLQSNLEVVAKHGKTVARQ